jgi:ribA/ribD-fused uncharacterized protein
MANVEIFPFYGKNNCFSNFFDSSIMIDGNRYNCVEQWYQYSKAVYFDDKSQAEKILATKEPAQQKRLGNLVAGYTEGGWALERDAVMERGLWAKFTQSKWCQKSLLSTETKRICEASPFDLYWGCGRARFDWRVDIPKYWTGENRLGEMLEEIRDQLRLKN